MEVGRNGNLSSRKLWHFWWSKLKVPVWNRTWLQWKNFLCGSYI